MKTYSMDHDGAMVERRSRKDRRVNPKITTIVPRTVPLLFNEDVKSVG